MRESSGSNIEKTLRKAVKVLAAFRIPHYVCGGFAVQEHGYPRFTVDVDLIVPDIAVAREMLCLNGFKENPTSATTVIDSETRVEIDPLPAGGKVDPGPLSFPIPVQVSEEPQIVSLESLIGSKLSGYMGRGIDRVQDYADVVRLIRANHLPREYGLDESVRDLYHRIWDELHRNRSKE